MKKILLLSIIVLGLKTNTLAQDYEWAKSFGGTSQQFINSTCIDNLGNLYATGYFAGSVDFDPGAGTTILSAIGHYDVFILKLDANGNYLWAKSFGGTFADRGNSIKVDASGNAYITGHFNLSVDFDPGAGTDNHTSSGNYDAFVQKLDVNGNFIWARTFGGALSNDHGKSISLDALGNIYTIGDVNGSGDFDPGAGTTILTPIGNNDVYIQKLDASGNFVWAKSFGGTDYDSGNSIYTDSSGNIYITGGFFGTADLDPGTGTDNHTSLAFDDSFIQKLDASGNLIWAKSFGGVNNDYGNSICVDPMGNIYTTGVFRGNADLDPGTGVINFINAGQEDAYIQKLDPSGNYVWAKAIGGTGDDIGNSISLDALGNVYTTGIFDNIVDFDPGTGTNNLTTVGFNDVYVQKLDMNGNFVWARSFGSPNIDYGRSISVDAAGNVYTAGEFQLTVDFDPGPGISNITAVSAQDIFIQKLGQCFPSSSNDVITICDSLTWIDGNTYTTNNNTATHTIIGGNSNGCDSIVTLDLTINNSTTGTDTRTECAPLTWIDGNTYTINNNTATFNIVAGNSIGCDSIVTLDLTINNPTTGTDIRTACDSFTWIDGATYTTNNNTATFNIVGGAANGCDSLVTLDLTITNSSAGTDTRTVCDSLTWIDGTTYTTNNNTAAFNIVGGAANGCDSLVTLDLIISNFEANYTFTDNGNGNYSFANTSTGNFNLSHWGFGDGTIDSIANPTHTFTTNGFFTVILTILDSTVQGDSCISYYIDTINVTGVTNPLPCHSGFAIYPDTVNGDVNIANSSTGVNLTYLWNFGDGNTSTLQNPSHTYTTAGPFYLCLTIDDGNGCVDMYCDSIGKNGVIFNKSGGFTINVITTGIDNINLNSEINIFPNPTSSQLTIDTEQNISEVKIIDITGKMIMITKENTINVANLSDGIYFIQLTTDNRTITKKFVKQ